MRRTFFIPELKRAHRAQRIRDVFTAAVLWLQIAHEEFLMGWPESRVFGQRGPGPAFGLTPYEASDAPINQPRTRKSKKTGFSRSRNGCHMQDARSAIANEHLRSTTVLAMRVEHAILSSHTALPRIV